MILSLALANFWQLDKEAGAAKFSSGFFVSLNAMSSVHETHPPFRSEHPVLSERTRQVCRKLQAPKSPSSHLNYCPVGSARKELENITGAKKRKEINE